VNYFWKTSHAFRFAFLMAMVGLLAFRAVWTAFREEKNRSGATHAVTLGLADYLTLARGLFICVLGGFLFSPQPDGWLAWIPGFLYLTVVSMDGVDGFLARRLGQASAFGEILDREFDGLGTAVATLLAFQYGKLPIFYLPVAGLYYVFQIGLCLYQKAGRPVSSLKNSNYRKIVGGLNSVFLSVTLWPVFGPPASFTAATILMLFVIASFIKDWLEVTVCKNSG
jgi:CDP-diacylglycerol---glycerol-3-phosphate 3-phosphatidyltransferase